MRKQYIKLFVFTLIFDLVYLIGFNWERQFRDARIYGGPFALSFVPALFLYMIFLWVLFIYCNQKVDYPQLLVAVFISIAFCWMEFYS